VNQFSADRSICPGIGQRASASRRRTARRIAQVHAMPVNLAAAFYGGVGQGALPLQIEVAA
jgi:hypothetical protein